MHIHCRTVTDHVKFVPYGKSVNDDASRIQYMTDMKGYCKHVLLPCFDLYEEVKGSLPKHLAEVGIELTQYLLTSAVLHPAFSIACRPSWPHADALQPTGPLS